MLTLTLTSLVQAQISPKTLWGTDPVPDANLRDIAQTCADTSKDGLTSLRDTKCLKSGKFPVENEIPQLEPIPELKTVYVQNHPGSEQKTVSFFPLPWFKRLGIITVMVLGPSTRAIGIKFTK